MNRPTSLTKTVAVAAMVVGLTAGGYGIAAAANTTSTEATGTATTPSATQVPSGPAGAAAQNPWGNQRSDETVLTGDALSKVKAAALAKVGSDATVVRIETEADGNGVYEAHMLKSDGSAVTVYFDKDYKVTSVDEGMGGPGGRHGGPNGPDAQSDTTATTANGA